MKHRWEIVLLGFFLAFSLSRHCIAGGEWARLFASEARLASGRTLHPANQRPREKVIAIDRRQLFQDVAEYYLTISVGTSSHDVIGLHRIVRDSSAWEPAPTRSALFTVHGDLWGFRSAFLPNLSDPSGLVEHALPIYLARLGIDVWGIDLRWTNVPASTTDLQFMRSWNMATDLHDIAAALRIARRVRSVSLGRGPINLLGWSRGGALAYAYASEETQLPEEHRVIKGLVVVDAMVKTDDETIRTAACERAAGMQELFEGGTVASQSGLTTACAGTQALSSPQEPSPLLPGFTNYQAALFLGSETFALAAPFQPPVPLYHTVAGTFDDPMLPTGLQFTSVPTWFWYLRGAAPYEPQRILIEGDQLVCGEQDLPYDDHLGEIELPVLYVGAAGGYGDYGLYTTTLLGSSDVRSHIVRLVPHNRLLDWGHAESFLARDAVARVWEPIRQWIDR